MVLCNFDLLWKNYGTMETNYGTMKTNYGTLPRTMELRFTMVKTIVDYQNLRNLLEFLNTFIALEL